VEVEQDGKESTLGENMPAGPSAPARERGLAAVGGEGRLATVGSGGVEGLPSGGKDVPLGDRGTEGPGGY
jgi:hypothetical protein